MRSWRAPDLYLYCTYIRCRRKQIDLCVCPRAPFVATDPSVRRATHSNLCAVHRLLRGGAQRRYFGRVVESRVWNLTFAIESRFESWRVITAVADFMLSLVAAYAVGT